MKYTESRTGGLVGAGIFLLYACAALAQKTGECDFPKAKQMMEQGRFEDALPILQAGTADDDLYHCMCNDAPHQHRSSVRHLAIVDCLLRLKRHEEARRELKALYEDKRTPRYIIPGDANILLIDLETKHDPAGFKKWLLQHRPTNEKDYEGSIQHITFLKSEIESGSYDGVLKLLRCPSYHIFYSPPRYGQEWQSKALVAYLVAQGDKALPLLLLQTKKVRNDRIYDIHLGAVFCIGEIGDSKAIPALREALQGEKNSSARLELIFALAKTGDKDVAAELLKHKVGSLDHQRYVDSLLRQLTGESFGLIENEASAKDIFAGWQGFLNKKDDAQQDKSSVRDKPRR